MRVRCRLFSGLLMFFMFIALIISPTFAWQSGNQEALNQTKGDGKVIDVELWKLEKTLDGQLTDTPISDVVFYLYKADGTQIGEQYQTDKDGKIYVQLAKGDYYFEEYNPGPHHTFDEENGVVKKKYPFTVTGNETQPIIVKAYNVPLKAFLTIKKSAFYEDGSPLEKPDTDLQFAFRVTFSDGGRYAYRINGGEEQFLSSGEVLYLRDGEQAVFNALPVGILYTVVEERSPFYTTISDGHQGNITAEGSVASFTNYLKKQYGSLRVSKEGKGDLGDQEFLFEIEINGKAETFPLKVGEHKDFMSLPLGTHYVVKEVVKEGDNYTATITRYEGTLNSKEMVELPFLNVANVENPTTGNLKVYKEVIGPNADPNKEFTFEVTFEGDGAPASPQRFVLKAGETKTFANIPHGVKYCVTEVDAGGYIAHKKQICGVITSDEEIVTTFVNEILEVNTEKATLEIRKEVTGNPPAEDSEKEFRITLTVDGVENIFTLKAGDKSVFELPINSAYEVSEDNYFDDGYTQSISNGTGTIQPGTHEVVITNKYMQKEMVTIEGEKTWELNGYDDVLPEFIRVQLFQGDKLVDEVTVRADENGLWKYKFEVPAFDSDGNRIDYYVKEVPLDSFQVEYDGYNIKNTYREPLTFQLPMVRKEISGDKAPNQYFSFIMEAIQGAPMPEGVQGNKHVFQLRGNEELSLGNIVYKEAGTYIYNIYEINEDIPGWTYDTSVYELRVEVVEKDGKLVANTTILKDQTETNAIIFSNIYNEDDANNVLYIEGKKIWNHGNNPNPPQEIIVQLYGDGVLLHQKRVSEAENWSYIFKVKRYADDGHEIVYTIQEVAVEGYDAEIDGYNIINTYRDENFGGGSDGDNGGNTGGGTDGSTGGNTDGSGGSSSGSVGTGDSMAQWIFLYAIAMGVSGAVIFGIYKKKSKQ